MRVDNQGAYVHRTCNYIVKIRQDIHSDHRIDHHKAIRLTVYKSDNSSVGCFRVFYRLLSKAHCKILAEQNNSMLSFLPII